MKSLPRLLVATVSAACVLGLLSACFSTPAEEQRRRDGLNAAVSQFEPDAISEVICDESGGEIGIKTGLTRDLVLAGADSWETASSRLATIGYRVSEVSPRLSGSGPGGITVLARLIPRPGAEPDLEEQLRATDCEIPEDGAVYMQFSETGADT
jgi:hypothetical protein